MDNKLGITDLIELELTEEKICKVKAFLLYNQKIKNVGSFQSLSIIHKYLFEELYDFAGKLRTVNLAKGDFKFAPLSYLSSTIKTIDELKQSTFEQIIEKYVEMNIAHPFREGNGRAMRIWLDAILKQEIGKIIDWSLINKDDYLYAMIISPIEDNNLKYLLRAALREEVNNFTASIDASFAFEDLNYYKTKDLI